MEEQMKKGIVALMVVSCLALGGLTVFLRFSEDRTAPEIQFQEHEVTFVQGEEYDSLLEGVTAIDKRDGDVTQSLTVESVYPKDDGRTAIVVYAARDTANNIAKSNRTVNYQEKDSPEGTQEEKTEEDSVLSPTPAAPEGTSDHQPGTGSDSRREDGLDTNQDDPDETDDEETLPEGHPRIKLSRERVTINAGESVNRISFVESITDDKDEKIRCGGVFRSAGMNLIPIVRERMS